MSGSRRDKRDWKRKERTRSGADSPKLKVSKQRREERKKGER